MDIKQASAMLGRGTTGKGAPERGTGKEGEMGRDRTHGGGDQLGFRGNDMHMDEGEYAGAEGLAGMTEDKLLSGMDVPASKVQPDNQRMGHPGKDGW